MAANKPSCFATIRTRLALLSVCLILVGSNVATTARGQQEAQRVPWGALWTGDTVGSLVADDASKVSDSHPTPVWPGGSSKNANHSSSAHGTDCQQRDNTPTPVGLINHLRAATWQDRVDKSSPVDPATSLPQLNHLRARRSPQTSGGVVSPPKLVQWSREPVQYHERSTLVLSCSLSYAGGEQASLKFAWFKQGKPLMMTNAGQLPKQGRLSIETLADYSFLRLVDLKPADSGAYTCIVSNSLGQEDRTTTQVIVNVKLRWLASTRGSDAANSSTTVGNGHQLERARAGQSVAFECNAAGGSGGGGGGYSKSPQVRWFRLMPTTTSSVGSATTSGLASSQGAAHPKHFRLGQLGGSSHRPDPARAPDEAQLRASLVQLDTVIGYTPAEGQPFRRIELIGDNELIQRGNELAGTDGIHHKQLRWRIATNTGASASSMPDQQHEVYSKLELNSLDPGAGGLYECEVIGLSQNLLQLDNAGGSASGDKLRRVFGLLVNGK